MKSLNLKTFKTLQHNITCILHINSSNKTFCSIHDFTFLVTDTKIKGQVSFEFPEKNKLLQAWFSVKFVMLSAQSIALANWFACVPACMSTIAQVSLTSLSYLIYLASGKLSDEKQKFSHSCPIKSCNFSNHERFSCFGHGDF